MDFNYNNFPEDEAPEMPPSKTYKVFRKIFKYSLYGISALVYLLLFWRIFSSCDPEMWEKNFFSDATNKLTGVTFYDINSTEFMSYSGVVQVRGNRYAEQSKELELGIKLNMKKTAYDSADRLVYVLRNSHGDEYEVTALHSERKRDYIYARVCFGNVDLKISENYYMQDARTDESGTRLGNGTADYPKGLSYRLFIYEKSDDGTLKLISDLVDYEYLHGEKELDESGICIYNNITVVVRDD